uniref:Uncharacterized protein n=1 Tax=Acrobeloides nanus TaxID=290746 RepID=A0A914D8U5_9BILA
MGIVYGLKVHNAFGRFSDKLSRYMNDANKTKFMEKFALASSMHSRGFYENEFTPIYVRDKIPSIREYLHMLASFEMNEDDINEMKKINFN